jgi:pimeloyl-ACP methyl ester carboxylesterase
MRQSMKVNSFIVAFAALMVWSASASVRASEEGYFPVGDSREVYAKVFRGDPNQPAIVLINGLTQDSDHWRSTLPEVLASGRTVVIYDAFLQGRSLERHIDKNNLWPQLGRRPILPPVMGMEALFPDPRPMLPAVPIEGQAEDLRELLAQLKINKATVVGLSYGGALALQYGADFPKNVENVVLVAPYVEPMAEQDQLIRFLVGYYQRAYPLIRFNEDELYDFLFRGLVLTSYHFVEPSILKWGPFQSFAVAELARGVRQMDVAHVAKRLPKDSVHLVIAGMDAYIARPSLMRFWRGVPSSARASLAVVEGVEHKVNESVGPFLGGWVRAIVDGKVPGGQEWSGIPEKGVMRSSQGGSAIALPAADPCENLLRPGVPGAPNLPVDRIQRNPAEIFIGMARAMMWPPVRAWFDQMVKSWFPL